MVKDGPRAARYRRHARIRTKIEGMALKPRLCIFRSLNHIYAQLIDDECSHTLTSASTIEPEIKGEVMSKNKSAQAELVGSLLAKSALGMRITQVVFDRGGYKYHGRIKALAEAAREGGLIF